jgi:hypothetical protein
MPIMRRPAKWLRVILIVEGLLMALAIVPAVMPLSWIEAVHQFLGLGRFPEKFLTEYLARMTSAMFAMMGALLMFLAWDVRRFAPVIKFVYFIQIPVVIAVMAVLAGRHVDIIYYWLAVIDAVFAVAFAVFALILVAKMSRLAAEGGPAPKPESARGSSQPSPASEEHTERP